MRYQSFDSQQSLEEGIRKNQPYKIDIGAIFSVKPSMRNRVQQASFKALRKELVFDIDMTDYDDIRTCCREANICNRCWRFMTIAMKIIDRALRGEKLGVPEHLSEGDTSFVPFSLQRILGFVTCCGCTAVAVASIVGCATGKP